MKLFRRIAAIVVTLTMAVSMMAVSAYATVITEETKYVKIGKDYSNGVILTSELINNPAETEQDEAYGKNTTDTTHYMIVIANTYDYVSGEYKYIKKTSDSGNIAGGKELFSGYNILYEPDWHSPRGKNSVTMYNGSVVMSGIYGSVSSDYITFPRGY